ncbi:endonuclease/exonuclease/phosphatase family protein [Salegentibacter salinarum]|nr:endonuclease/exonuclease/phosphatase family protein [Salegentibacter salinarum]
MIGVKYIIGAVLMAASFISCEESGNKTTTADENKAENEMIVDRTLRVMSYNIHHANPPAEEDKIDIAAIVKVIKAEDPDLVALQEVDFSTERSGEGNQAELIAKALDMEYYFAKAIDYDNGEYGNAILSKFPIKEGEILDLPNHPEDNTENRVVALGLIEINEDQNILFGSTHLDYKKDSKSRILQVKKLIESANERNEALILGGDFNDDPDSETIQLLDSELERTCKTCPPTIPVKNPQRAIDFIYYKHPQTKFQVKSHKVIPEEYASDHRPVFAEIDIVK